MNGKPIYEFPPRLSRTEKQAKAVHDLQEHKKMRSNMYRNVILGAVIFAIAFLAKIAVIKILLMLISLGNIIVALLLYRFYALSRDTDLYTRIYEDGFEHCQNMGFTKKKLLVTLYFNEIEKSYQDNHGRMVIKLKNAESSSFTVKDKRGEESVFVPEDKTVTLSFADTQSKLKLISDFYEQMKYPHKEYKKIDDEADDYYTEEDMKWDRLHKHGL